MVRLMGPNLPCNRPSPTRYRLYDCFFFDGIRLLAVSGPLVRGLSSELGVIGVERDRFRRDGRHGARFADALLVAVVAYRRLRTLARSLARFEPLFYVESEN